MKTKATMMVILLSTMFISIAVSVNVDAEEQEFVLEEWISKNNLNIPAFSTCTEDEENPEHNIIYHHQNFGGKLDVLESGSEDRQEDENKNIEPAPHPALDLPANIGVFIFSTLTISFVLYVTKFKRLHDIKFTKSSEFQ